MFINRSLFVAVGLLLAIACGGGSKGAPTPTSVGAPTNLVATPNGAFGAILFEWTAPATAIDGYEFEGRKGVEPYTKLHDGLLPATWIGATLTLSSSAGETSDFTFRLRAIRGSAASGYSNEASYHLGIVPPYVGSPYQVPGGIQISWTNNSVVADTLLLERGITLDAGQSYTWTTIPGVALATSTWLDRGPFTEGAGVSYRVTYSKGSDRASRTSANPVTMGMDAPKNLVATPGVEAVHLTWANDSHLATEVAVMRSADLGPYPSYQQVALLPVGTTSYDDTLLATGYYTYRLENRKAGASPAPSTEVRVVTLPPQNGASVLPTILTLPQADTIRRSSRGEWFLSGPYPYNPLVREPSGDTWIDYTPPSATGWSAPFFLLDSQDRPHTVYARSTVQGTQEVALMHSWRDAAGWQTEEIARRILYSSWVTSGYTFTLDAGDRLHVLWAKVSGGLGDLEYAAKDGNGAWVVTPLPPPPATSTMLGTYKLTVDPTGQPHVLIGAWQELFHLTPTAGNWTVETVPATGVNAGWYDFTAIAASGPDAADVFVTKSHQPYDGSYDVLMLRKLGGNWLSPEVVLTTTGYAGFTGILAANKSATRLALFHPTGAGNMVRVWSAGVWTSSLLGPSNYGTPLVDFDAHDKLYLLLPAGLWSTSTGFPYVLYQEQP